MTIIYQMPRKPFQPRIIPPERHTISRRLKLHDGTFDVTSDGCLRFTNAAGEESLYDYEAAQKIYQTMVELMHALRTMVEQLNGFYRRSARIDGTRTMFTICHEEREVRLSELRKPRTCEACRAVVSRMWVTVKSKNIRLFYAPKAEVCDSCMSGLLGQRGRLAVVK